jgi:hypothetical protein
MKVENAVNVEPVGEFELKGSGGLQIMLFSLAKFSQFQRRPPTRPGLRENI